MGREHSLCTFAPALEVADRANSMQIHGFFGMTGA
jgi:hypothetical protein